MALDGCGLVCKYILIIFNIIFSLLGFAFLGLGLWLRFSPGTRGIFEIEDLNSSAFVTIVSIMIAIGAGMLIVVMFGDYGACNEKRCSLQVFSVLLTIMALIEIVIGVLSYVNKEQFGETLVEFYSSMYVLYVKDRDPVIGATLTFIHKTLDCCGITGIPIVEIAKATCPKPDGFLKSLITDNCPGIIINVLDRKAALVMGLFIGTGLLLLIALVCTAVLLKQLKKVQQEISAYYTTVY
ncbi:uncharacterized protein V6R79_007336 [Siganus canaliculatus]